MKLYLRKNEFKVFTIQVHRVVYNPKKPCVPINGKKRDRISLLFLTDTDIGSTRVYELPVL